MNHDPVVEEARAAGQAYVNSFNGDWKALLADLRRRSEEGGRRPVSLPPKAPKPRPVPRRKVG
jgi:hypothetical protein